jgi:sugar O-acyltransferase (sialic acid O-acetyltransferase NeuD family)
MKEIIIWGASGHAKVLNEFCEKVGYKLVALFDNNRDVVSPVAGVPLHYAKEGFIHWMAASPNRELRCLIAIGGSRGRDRFEIQHYLQSQGVPAATVVHPAAYVAESAILGEGSQILAGAVVGVETTIGSSCIVNTASSVDHECVIEDGVHIAPGVTLAGCVHVGRFSFLGVGATVLPRIRIGSDCVVGAGSLVTRDIPDGVVAYGNPARIVRKNSFDNNTVIKTT